MSAISLLDKQQIEKLAEIGQELRVKRQEQDLSLEKLATKTRIQQRLLQALEEGKLDELPEPIYIQSFIKKYADALGIDGAELADKFPPGYSWLRLKPAWQRIPGFQLRAIHLYLLYVFVIVCTVNALSNTLSRSEQQNSRNQFAVQQNIQPPKKPQQVIPKPRDIPKAAIATNKPVRINVTLKAESWMRVVADGKTEFEGVLPQGTQRTWMAHEQITLRAGNAGGVMVTFDQEKQPKQMGDLGEVQEVTFAANQRS